MPLTALGVKNAKPQAKPYNLADEKSLYLLVTPSGSKLWRFDYRYENKRKTLALGIWDDIELAQARVQRDAARKTLADGYDPGIAQTSGTARVQNDIETICRNWHASAKGAWTPRYAKLVLGRLEADIFPHLGRDDVDSIEPPRLLEVIRKIEARGAVEMAKRVYTESRMMRAVVDCVANYIANRLDSREAFIPIAEQEPERTAA